MASRNPYLGPSTYGFEHRDIFFGRKGEGRLIASLLAAEPISILTGASGTGKSSLIRAEIVPSLVEFGWLPIYAHSSDSPLDSLGTELFEQALPRPSAERERLLKIIKHAKGEITEKHSVSEMRSWFANLEPGDQRRQELIASSYKRLPRHTLTAFMLANALSTERYITRLSSLAEYSNTSLQEPHEDPALSDLLDLLDSAAIGREHLVNFIGLHQGNFIELSEALWFGWAKPLDLLGIVFILDQAEELYTNFGSENADSSRWMIRDELFAQVETFAELSTRMPVRLNFSLRPEWYIELLNSLGPHAPDDHTATYFLSRLKPQNALEVFTHPPKALGLDTTPDVGEFVVQELSRQGDRGLIDPFILAVTLGKCWDKALERCETEKLELKQADLDQVMTHPEAGKRKLALEDGAIRHLLADALKGLAKIQQDDAWNLLEMLFTDEWTRRVLTEREVTDWPMRRRQDFQGLLQKLDDASLVRRFRRGKNLVEIRHERISLAFRSQRAGNEESGERRSQAMRERKTLLHAIEWLTAFSGERFEMHLEKEFPDDPLPGWVADALRESADQIEWDQPSARLFLVSLMHDEALGVATDGHDDSDLEGIREKLKEFLFMAARPDELKAHDFRRRRGHAGKGREKVMRGMRIEPNLAIDLLAKRSLAQDSELREQLLRNIMAQPTAETQDETGAVKWIDQMLVRSNLSR